MTTASSCEKSHGPTGEKALGHTVAAAKEISMDAAIAAGL